MDKCIIVWKKLCEYIEKEIARTNLKESKLFSGTDADPELAKKGDACVGWFIKPIAFFSLNVVIAVVVACTPYFELSWRARVGAGSNQTTIPPENTPIVRYISYLLLCRPPWELLG